MAKKLSITGHKKVSIKPDRARKLIRHFHVLLKSKAAADAANDVAKSLEIDKEIADLGGLKTYQAASICGQSNSRGGDSSKLLVGWLSPDFTGTLLEVGCLQVNNACAQCKKFTQHVRIDLNSQHPQIIQQDFMTMKRNQLFSVISLSLVLNYVPDPLTRGQMLFRAHDFLEPNGLLFFVLPRACIDNSRYCTKQTIAQIMAVVGFTQLREHTTAKLVYWLYRKDQRGPKQSLSKKKVCDAPAMNNFAITL